MRELSEALFWCLGQRLQRAAPLPEDLQAVLATLRAEFAARGGGKAAAPLLPSGLRRPSHQSSPCGGRAPSRGACSRTESTWLCEAPDVAATSSSKTMRAAGTAVLAGGAIALAQRKARPSELGLRAWSQGHSLVFEARPAVRAFEQALKVVISCETWR